ncbi:MAG: sulfurtransferase/chromate resistance protein [Roseiarcus sp.]
MPSINTISVEQLTRLVGTPKCPALIDVRPDDDFAADARLLPAAIRRSHADVRRWAQEFHERSVIVIGPRGESLGHGVAAWLRHGGVSAETLEGGFDARKRAGLPLVIQAKLPRRDEQGHTVWVTRERPKVDRIACPWLIRRFVDPAAVFLFVKPSEVAAVAETFQATPFDIEGVHWSHRGDKCTFDVMIEELGLITKPLSQLATIVRGADTARLDLALEAPGLLAASLGLSRMYDNDLAQLDAGMTLYDAFYRWCRDATAETHTSHSRRGTR